MTAFVKEKQVNPSQSLGVVPISRETKISISVLPAQILTASVHRPNYPCFAAELNAPVRRMLQKEPVKQRASRGFAPTSTYVKPCVYKAVQSKDISNHHLR